MACCYGYENARTTKDGAIVTEDTSIEIDNITKEDKLYTWSILVNEIKWLNNLKN
jgi:nuclear transport factor 2 (NTF2) superfamily protein